MNHLHALKANNGEQRTRGSARYTNREIVRRKEFAGANSPTINAARDDTNVDSDAPPPLPATSSPDVIPAEVLPSITTTHSAPTLQAAAPDSSAPNTAADDNNNGATPSTTTTTTVSSTAQPTKIARRPLPNTPSLASSPASAPSSPLPSRRASSPVVQRATRLCEICSVNKVAIISCSITLYF